MRWNIDPQTAWILNTLLININLYFKQSESGACYVFASTLVAYYAQARYRNCPLPLPSLAWPIDGAHMPGFRCLGLDGGFPFDQMRWFMINGVLSEGQYGRKWRNHFLRAGLDGLLHAYQSLEYEGDIPPAWLADFCIKSISLAVNEDTPDDEIVPRIDDALSFLPVVFETRVCNVKGFDLRNQNPWLTNRPKPGTAADPTASLAHLTKVQPAHGQKAEMHAMVILARCDAGEEVNCGLWLKPYPTFDEPVYLIYNSWDTANNGFVFLPVSELKNVVIRAVKTVPKLP